MYKEKKFLIGTIESFYYFYIMEEKYYVEWKSWTGRGAFYRRVRFT